MTISIKNCPVTLPLEKLSTRIKLTQYIAIHCSATRASQNIGVTEIDAMHRERGFTCIGYHYVIKRDGSIERGRPMNTIGAHVEGYNSISIAVCLIGGINSKGKPENNFTPAQFVALRELVPYIKQTYPIAMAKGHRDFSKDLNKDGKITPNEWMKDCPCFDVKEVLDTK